MRDVKKDLKLLQTPVFFASEYCQFEIRVALRYWIERSIALEESLREKTDRLQLNK